MCLRGVRGSGHKKQRDSRCCGGQSMGHCGSLLQFKPSSNPSETLFIVLIQWVFKSLPYLVP